MERVSKYASAPKHCAFWGCGGEVQTILNGQFLASGLRARSVIHWTVG